MSCYHPNKLFPIGKTASGKTDYLFCEWSTHHIECDKNGEWHRCYDDFVSQFSTKVIYDFIEIGCGKCIGCRLDKSREWANRCLMELEEHASSYFLTLTYDDVHIPSTEYIDTATGEYRCTDTLRKKDLQNFIKALRQSYAKRHEGKLRFYSCGEYGTHTQRPHYHIIMFGLELEDLKFYSRTSEGYSYFTSEYLNNIWQKGYIIVGQVTWETCAYTSRYVMKKAGADLTELYKLRNQEPEFTAMSTHPGIAKHFFEKRANLLDYHLINLSTAEGGKKVPIPRYFKKLEDKKPLLERNQNYVNSAIKTEGLRNDFRDAPLEHTSLDYLEYLSNAERKKLKSIKALERRKV